jgi:hypothetical protein
VTTSRRSSGKKFPVDVQHAKLVPHAEFGHPDQVADASNLSTSEKKKILNQWEVDDQALSRASDEGMTGGEMPGLRHIQTARRKVAGGISTAKDRRHSGKPDG